MHPDIHKYLQCSWKLLKKISCAHVKPTASKTYCGVGLIEKAGERSYFLNSLDVDKCIPMSNLILSFFSCSSTFLFEFPKLDFSFLVTVLGGH